MRAQKDGANGFHIAWHREMELRKQGRISLIFCDIPVYPFRRQGAFAVFCEAFMTRASIQAFAGGEFRPTGRARFLIRAAEYFR